MRFSIRKAAFISGAVALLPLVASAQSAFGDVQNYARSASIIVGILIGVLFAVAVILFFWGVIQMIIAKDPKAARTKVIYGIVGIFVMVALYGIINFVGRNLGIDTTTNVIQVPTVKY